MKFKAENGETITAQNDVQAAAFKNAGLKEVVEKSKKGEVVDPPPNPEDPPKE